MRKGKKKNRTIELRFLLLVTVICTGCGRTESVTQPERHPCESSIQVLLSPDVFSEIPWSVKSITLSEEPIRLTPGEYSCSEFGEELGRALKKTVIWLPEIVEKGHDWEKMIKIKKNGKFGTRFSDHTTARRAIFDLLVTSTEMGYGFSSVRDYYKWYIQPAWVAIPYENVLLLVALPAEDYVDTEEPWPDGYPTTDDWIEEEFRRQKELNPEYDE